MFQACSRFHYRNVPICCSPIEDNHSRGFTKKFNHFCSTNLLRCATMSSTYLVLWASAFIRAIIFLDDWANSNLYFWRLGLGKPHSQHLLHHFVCIGIYNSSSWLCWFVFGINLGLRFRLYTKPRLVQSLGNPFKVDIFSNKKMWGSRFIHQQS